MLQEEHQLILVQDPPIQSMPLVVVEEDITILLVVLEDLEVVQEETHPVVVMVDLVLLILDIQVV